MVLNSVDTVIEGLSLESSDELTQRYVRSNLCGKLPEGAGVTSSSA